MQPITGLQNQQMVDDLERVDINPNANPAYIPHEDSFAIEPGKITTDMDFTYAIKNTLVKLKSFLGSNMPDMPDPVSPSYYVETDGETEETEESTETEGSGYKQIDAPLSGSPSTSGTNTSSLEIQQQAIEATEALLNEADQLINELKDGDWEIEQDGYKYVDPEFYVKYQALMGILNVVNLIGIILDLLRSLRGAVAQSSFGQVYTPSNEVSASEILGSAREIGLQTGTASLLDLSEEVATWNQAVLQEKINDAKKEAKQEAGTFWDWWCDIVTSGGAKANQRHEDALFTKKAYQIMKEYEAFNKHAQDHYEKVLAKKGLFEDGLTDIGNFYEGLTGNNLVFDIGSGKVDIDRTKLVTYQQNISFRENRRRLLALLHSAIQDFKRMVVEICYETDISSNLKGFLNDLLGGLENYENMCFSALSQQMQASIIAQNKRVEAYYAKEKANNLKLSSWTAGAVPLLGGMLRGIGDWIAMEVYDSRYDFTTNPSQLDSDKFYRMLMEIYSGALSDLGENAAVRESIKEYKKLEFQEWEILAKLNENNVVCTGADGYKGTREAQVNQLREQLVRVQNKERGIVMFLEGLFRILKAIVKITTGGGSVEGLKDVQAGLKNALDGRLIAFDIKFSGIKNKVEAFNLKKKEQDQVAQARSIGIGSIVGLVVAVILIIIAAVTYGATLPLVISMCSAWGALGGAVGNLIYLAGHRPDDSIREKTAFYDKMRGDLDDQYEDKLNDELDRLNEHSHIDAENSSDPMATDDMWALDTALFMDVRSQLVKIYLEEHLFNMINKSIVDLLAVVGATSSGVYVGDDFWAVKGSSVARFKQKVKAYSLKEQMVKDIISNHNLVTQYETEKNWAILQVCISAVAAVASAAGACGGEYVQQGTQTFEWISWSAQLAGMAAQAAKGYLEANSGYSELGEYQKIAEIIEMMVNSSLYGSDGRQLKAILGSINENNVVEGVKGGKTIADSTAYYKGVRQIQKMYNRLIAIMRIQEAIGKIKARIAGAPTSYGLSDAMEAEKEMYLQQLGLLQARVETYVERTNAMVEAMREAIVATVMVAVVVILKILQETGTINKLKKEVNEALGADKTDSKAQLLDSKSKLRVFISKLLTGHENGWDGSLGWSDLINILVDLVLSPQTMKYIAKQIIDAAYTTDEKAQKAQKESANRTGENSKLDNLDSQAYNNQLRLAELETSFAEMGFDSQRYHEDLQMICDVVDTSIKAVADDSWWMSQLSKIFKLSPDSEIEGKGPVSIIDVMSTTKEKILPLLQDVKPEEIVDRLQQTAKVIQEAKKTDNSDFNAAEKEVAMNAAVTYALDQLPNDPKAKQVAAKELAAFVVAQTKNSERNPMAMAMALGTLVKLSDKDAEQAIAAVWSAAAKGEISAVEAEQITSLVTQHPANLKGRIEAEMVPETRVIKELVGATKKQDYEEVERILEQETEVEDKTTKPDQHFVSHLAAMQAAQHISSRKPEERQKIAASLEAVAKDTKNSKALRDYAQVVLDRVQGNKTEIANASDARHKLARRIYVRALTIEALAKDGGDIQPQLEALKADLLLLYINHDTKDFPETHSLAEVKAKIKACKTLEDVQAVMNFMLDNTKFLPQPILRKQINDAIEALENAGQKVAVQIEAERMVKVAGANMPALKELLAKKANPVQRRKIRKALAKKGVVVNDMPEQEQVISTQMSNNDLADNGGQQEYNPNYQEVLDRINADHINQESELV